MDVGVRGLLDEMDGVAVVAVVIQKGGKKAVIVGARNGAPPDGARRHMHDVGGEAALRLDDNNCLLKSNWNDQRDFHRWLESQGAGLEV